MRGERSEDEIWGYIFLTALFVIGFGLIVGSHYYISSSYIHHKIFYALSGILPFIISVRLLTMSKECVNIKSSLTPALATSIITISATGGITLFIGFAVNVCGLDTLKYLIKKITLLGVGGLVGVVAIHTLILLCCFLAYGIFRNIDDIDNGNEWDYIQKDNILWIEYFISLVISTCVPIALYTNSIDTFINIGMAIIVILVISFAIEPYYKKKKEERKAYEEKKEYLIRRMNEILKWG
ncbi:MAG: hypothetical protein DRP01_02710 [Archaeoglobales archaeon]|nr:MAG: hypothetical protein DRP01_02710 [Archaeoglobales archaeon]